MPPHAQKKRYRDDTESDMDEFVANMPTLDQNELDLLKQIGKGPYSSELEKLETSITRLANTIKSNSGLEGLDCGLAPPSQWDMEGDMAIVRNFMALQIATITNILGYDKTVMTSTGVAQQQAETVTSQDSEAALQEVVNKISRASGSGDINSVDVSSLEGLTLDLPQLLSNQSRGYGGAQPPVWRACIDLFGHINYVVSKDENIAPADLEEGMRVACDRSKYSIRFPLPPLIDPLVSLMQVDDRPNLTYRDIGGCAKQLKLIRESLELPLLHPQRFTNLGIEPCKGLLFYGSPGSGKTLTARAVANRTESTFIRILGSELISKYSSEGARLVREIFSLARTKKSAILFFDEVDSWGLKRSVNASETGDTGVQRTMLELITQLDGFKQRGNVKVIMASNRPDILDAALTRPGRIDKKIEFGLPDQKGREEIYEIYLRKMSVEKNIRVKLLARLSPNASGAEIRSICTEAGMYCLRDKRRLISEADFLKAIDKVVKDYRRLVSTAKYLVANKI